MSRLVRVDHIDPSPWADLFEHPEEHIARLAEDIAERGIQTPLHVYPRGSRYELLTGHDRLEAAKRCGLEMVPVEVRTTLTDEDERFAYFLKDNTLRKDVDKRAVVRAALTMHPDWSNSRIGKVCGASHEWVRQTRAEMEAAGNLQPVASSVGLDGKERPAHKPPRPKPSPIPTRRKDGRLDPIGAMRAMREAQARGSAAFEEPAGPTEPEPHDDTPEPELAAPTKPAAPDRSKLVPPRRPYTARMKALVAAAQDAADASDEEIAAIPTNDLMIAGLKRARDLLDRIITHHTSKGRSYVSA